MKFTDDIVKLPIHFFRHFFAVEYIVLLQIIAIG